mgnify:CR=1 FL=1
MKFKPPSITDLSCTNRLQYQGFENKPPVVLVHGEEEAMTVLAQKLKHQYQVDVVQASYKQNIVI